ncbi:MAG: CDP-alcohol phosphatidyltransferase family protein [Actinobacteria bacterium]|nr:CDP-alcohol phosphatidyltransferase family protein [Actinomycetota bacterium]
MLTQLLPTEAPAREVCVPPVTGEPVVTADGTPAEPGLPVSGRIATLPNLLSLLRLLGVPLFVYLLLGPHADLWALAVLIFASFSDYLDGRLARAWNQVSRLGQLLDPLADRLYIIAALVAFVLRDIIPWQLAAVLIGRDAVLAASLPVLRHYGYGPLPVHYLGKAATFCLLYAIPFLLLAAGHGLPSTMARPIGWAFAVWGTALYCWAGGLYLVQATGLVTHEMRRGGGCEPPGRAPAVGAVPAARGGAAPRGAAGVGPAVRHGLRPGNGRGTAGSPHPGRPGRRREGPRKPHRPAAAAGQRRAGPAVEPARAGPARHDGRPPGRRRTA